MNWFKSYICFKKGVFFNIIVTCFIINLIKFSNNITNKHA